MIYKKHDLEIEEEAEALTISKVKEFHNYFYKCRTCFVKLGKPNRRICKIFIAAWVLVITIYWLSQPIYVRDTLASRIFFRDALCFPWGVSDKLHLPIHARVANFKRKIGQNMFYKSTPVYNVTIVKTDKLIFSSKDWYRNLQLTQRHIIEAAFEEGLTDMLFLEDDIVTTPRSNWPEFNFYINYARLHNVGFLSLQSTGDGCLYAHSCSMLYIQKKYYYEVLKPKCYMDDSMLPVDICLTKNFHLFVIQDALFTRNDDNPSTHTFFDKVIEEIKNEKVEKLIMN